MKKYVLLIVVFCFYFFCVNAQVGIGTTNPNASALLDLTSNNSGVLIPRMTASQKNAIDSPANGLLIFQTNEAVGLYYYDSSLSVWKLSSNTLPTTPSIGTMVYWGGTSWVEVVPSENEGASLQIIGGVPTWVGGTPPPPVVGDLIAGGIVFYVAPTPTDLDGDGTLDLGLVCALNDYSTNVVWGCYGIDLPSVPNVNISSGIAVGLGAEIGDGMANTNGMLNDCPSSPAALAARSMGTEWFLPSAAELNEIFEQQSILEGVTGFSSLLMNFYYWTSSENEWLEGISSYAYSIVTYNYIRYKFYSYRVRAIRAFH